MDNLEKTGVIKHISYRYDYDPLARSSHPYTEYEFWIDNKMTLQRRCGALYRAIDYPIVNNVTQFKKLVKLIYGKEFPVEKYNVHLDFQAQR